MSKFTCYKNTKNILNQIEIQDGQMLIATDEKTLYLDHANQRIKIAPEFPKIPSSIDEIAEGTTNKYDKTIALTAGSGIAVTGSYPNFTITNTSEGGGSGGQVNSFYTNSSYCVLTGNIGSNGKPMLFDGDYQFFVTPENPLVVAFADGFTKVFTSIVNQMDFLPPVFPDTGDDLDYSTYLIINEDSSIELFYKSDTYYKISDSEILPKPTNKGIWIDISGSIPVSKVWDNQNRIWVKKNICVIGENIFKRVSSVITGETITYPYNQNEFNGAMVNKICSPVNISNVPEVQLDSNTPYYALASELSANTSIVVKKPNNIYRTSFAQRYMQEYTVIFSVNSETITIDFKDEFENIFYTFDSTTGFKGKGFYMLRIYIDSGIYSLLGEVKYFKPVDNSPPIVDPDPSDPFDPDPLPGGGEFGGGTGGDTDDLGSL